MKTHENHTAPVPQRWERPFNFPPGIWKQQLAGKYRQLAVRGDLDALRELLKEHPEFLNKRGSHERTLLWEAVRRGKLEVVKWLVEQGADVDANGCYNSESHVQLTPYCAAIYYGRAAVADYLRPRSAQPDIFRAAFLGDQGRVADLLAADPSLLNADDPRDALYFMPLIAFAILGGHTEMVEFLLQKGAVVEPSSALLLDLAARASRLDLIELLVAHGVDVRAVDGGIFLTAVDITIFRYLIDNGAPVDKPGKNSTPPLAFIARGDKAERPDKVQALLEHGAQVNAADPKGRTALHGAAVGGHVKVMRILLDHGADVRLRDHEGQTALALARTGGKTAAIELLKQRGADQ
ncbi:MAG: ankyrin repeat domain-containing protein [Chloroflexota bacterium]